MIAGCRSADEALGSRVSIQLLVGQRVLRHPVSVSLYAPSDNPQKAIGIKSPIEPSGCHHGHVLACTPQTRNDAGPASMNNQGTNEVLRMATEQKRGWMWREAFIFQSWGEIFLLTSPFIEQVIRCRIGYDN